MEKQLIFRTILNLENIQLKEDVILWKTFISLIIFSL